MINFPKFTIPLPASIIKLFFEVSTWIQQVAWPKKENWSPEAGTPPLEPQTTNLSMVLSVINIIPKY